MKTKRIKIRTKYQFFSDVSKVANDLDHGRKTKHLRGEYFESLEAVRNILTEKRLELWKLIRDKKPKSISDLARLTGRNFKSVYQDVSLLVKVGLVELRNQKGSRGNIQKPTSMVDSLLLEVA